MLTYPLQNVDIYMSFWQLASESSDKQTSLQIIRHQQTATVKGVGFSEDQTKGKQQKRNHYPALSHSFSPTVSTQLSSHIHYIAVRHTFVIICTKFFISL